MSDTETRNHQIALGEQCFMYTSQNSKRPGKSSTIGPYYNVYYCLYDIWLNTADASGDKVQAKFLKVISQISPTQQPKSINFEKLRFPEFREEKDIFKRHKIYEEVAKVYPFVSFQNTKTSEVKQTKKPKTERSEDFLYLYQFSCKGNVKLYVKRGKQISNLPQLPCASVVNYGAKNRVYTLFFARESSKNPEDNTHIIQLFPQMKKICGAAVLLGTQPLTCHKIGTMKISSAADAPTFVDKINALKEGEDFETTFNISALLDAKKDTPTEKRKEKTDFITDKFLEGFIAGPQVKKIKVKGKEKDISCGTDDSE